MKLRLIPSAAAATLSLVAPVAIVPAVHAATVASASISDLGVQVFDLDPFDGIDPQITFGSWWGYDSQVFARATDHVSGASYYTRAARTSRSHRCRPC